MILNNIIILITVSVAYIFLFALLPFWVRGYKLSGDNTLDKLVSSFLYGHIIIIACAYTLSFIGIFYSFTMTGLLIALIITYRFTIQRKKTINFINHFIATIHDLSDGYYHPRVLIKNILMNIRAFHTHVFNKAGNPIGFISTLAIFGFAAYTKSYHSVVNSFFGTSDLYTHMEWIKYFMNNRPFYDGVYPFGYHAVISSLSAITGINTTIVLQMMGPVTGLLIVFALYYLLRRITKSLFAVNVVIALYCVTDIFPYWASERLFFAVPQEYGMIFLYFTAYFLYKYIKEKNINDLISFSSAVALTVLIHFFVTEYAILICLPVFIFCLVYLNKKTFIRLVIGVICAMIVSVAPIATGLAMGIPFQGSMDWAMGVLSGKENEADEEIDDTDVITEEDEITNTSEKAPHTIKSIFNALINGGYFNDKAVLDNQWFIPYLASALLCLASPFFRFKNRNKERQWIFAGFAVYSLMLCILFILSVLNIFSFMEYSRIYVFFIYSLPLVFVLPLDMLHALLYGTKKLSRAVYITCISIVSLLGIFCIGYYQRFMPLARILQQQHNGAMTAFYDILKKYPTGNWIIVSSFTEYTICLFEGYHHEMAEFIVDLEKSYKNSENPEIVLDSEHIFFYVVKRPNKYLDTDVIFMNSTEKLPLFDEKDAYVDLEEYYTIHSSMSLYRIYEINSVIQAKAQAWANEYIKYFSDEMSIFYEDDDIVVYHIKQNPYSLNNFAIRYAGNSNVVISENEIYEDTGTAE